MANTNFIVQNGLTVGPLTIWAANGDVTTTGSITTSSSTSTYNDIIADTVSAGTIGNTGATIIGTHNGPLNGPFNGTVGATTANTGKFTTLTATTQYDGAMFGPFNGTVGATTANTGKFTTLTATTQYDGAVFGPVNGTIGATTANTGAFTTLSTTGNITAGSNMNITGNIIPSANVTYNLGSTTNRFKDLYLSGTSIDLAGVTISAAAGGISVASLTTTGDVTVGGNLTVSGTQTIINSTAISVNDLNIVLANNAASAAAADGAGITVNGASATITYTNATTSWNFNKPIIGAGGIQNTVIGNSTAAAGTFTTLTATSGYQGAASGPFNGTVGATTANTGAFTTLTASSTIIATGNIVASSTTDSTSTTTGSLVVSGGLGVAKNMVISGNITPSANVTYDLGSTTAWFNNIYGIAVQAKYADLAEYYAGDADYESGTVVDFGGDKEVTISSEDSSPYVAGVVSTNPAYNMNSGIDAEFPIAVALTGRVPTKVTGIIQKGQMLVSAGNGRARAELNPAIGTVIGKALENFSGDEGIIEVVIGKN